jgi:hypothetical protein
VTLEQRKQAFYTTVVTKKWACAKQPSYKNRYQYLILIRRSTELLFSAMLILSGQQLLLETGLASPLWVTSGVGLAALFLRGYFLLSGIFLGTLLSYLYNHFSWPLGLSQSVLFIFFLYLTRALSLRWIGPITPLPKVAVLGKFIALMSALSAVHVWLVTILFFKMWPSLSLWYLGWLGEINSILCLVPLCLMFDPFVPAQYFNLQAWKWWMCGALLIIAHVPLLLLPPLPSIIYSLALVIALNSFAWAFGKIPTAFTLLGISVIYLGGVGTFSTNSMSILYTLFTLNIILSLSVAIYRDPKGTVTNSTSLDAIG